MKKRILTVLLAVCLVFALGTVSALAADDTTTSSDVIGSITSGSTTKEYTDVDEFLSAANSVEAGSRIELLANIEVDLDEVASTSAAIVINDNNVVFDGNKNTITAKSASAGDNGSHVISVEGNVQATIQELIINGNSVAHHGIHVYGGAMATINDVTISGHCAYGLVVNEANATVTGLKVGAGAEGAWGSVNVDSKDSKAEASFSNSEFVSDFVLDSQTDSTNNVTLTQVSANIVKTNTNAGDTVQSAGNNTINVNGGNITTISLNGAGTDKVDVKGQATVVTIENKHSDTEAKPQVTVTNSTVKNIDTSKFELKANDSEINGSDQTDSVAKVGDQYFDTLQEAINAAQNGTTKTVTLLKNFEVDITNTTDSLYRINGSITIDGDNRTITIKDIDAERDVKIFNVTSGTVTFEDLTIDGNDVAKHGIQAFGTGTNVTLNNVTSNENTGYGVLANGGAKVSATKLYTDDNGWGGVNVDKGAKFTMNSGTLGEEFSVVVESQDNSVTSDTVANLINGTYNKIQIKTNKSDVNISGGSYTDIVGYSDSKGSYTPNSGDASVTGGTFRNNVNEFATVNYVVSGSRGYTYFNDFDKAMAYAGVGDDIDFIGSSTTRTHTVRFYYENNVYDVYEVVDDDEVELPTGQYDGKRIDGWKRDDGKVFKPGDDVTITRNTDFTVILRNGQYNIVIGDDIKHGDVSTDVSSADKGATVYIYVDPDIGYVLDDLDVYYGYRNQYSVNVKFVRTGVYSFIMPGNDVYITATFRYESLPFTDVNRGQWFYDEVYYVYTNGMMEGDSATTFNPDGRMTRAMFWAVLGRIDGATITGNDWAEEARAWAMREGVSDGTNPNDYVTREQMVTMLWRYAGEKNGSASLIRYTDADKISSYAVEAMRWAIGNGIIEGMTSTTLEPQGTATRAQCAAIFMRFDQM